MNNRIIKFRAYDNINKKMYYPENFLNSEGIFYEYDENGHLQINKVTDAFGTKNYFVIQQFVGLQDINKKDMYEGDIVKHYVKGVDNTFENIDTIVYFESFFGLKNFHSVRGHEKIPTNLSYWWGIPRYEVIGNILESPELLNNK